LNKKKISLTVLILTYNEEIHIQRCIKSVYKFAEQIIIIDSYSNDQTLKLCKKYNKKIKIFKNKFVNQAKQINWALKNINFKSNWVLRLDADEYLSEGLRKNIHKINKIHENYRGIILKRKVVFLNKIINYGGTSPHKTLRIWKNGFAKCQNVWMDEQIIVKGKIFDFDEVIYDHNLNNLSWWINKHKKYSIREAKNYYEQKNKKNIAFKKKDLSKFNQRMKYKYYYKLPLFIRPFLLFLFSYILKLGFLSGIRGFIFYFSQVLLYRLMVDFNIFKKIK